MDPITSTIAVPTGQSPYLEDVPLEYLTIDRTEDGGYQRPINERWVEKHVSLFDPLQLGALKVSRRDETTYAVIDGQQRHELLRRVNREAAPCLVYEGLTREQEAYLFVQQDDKKEVSPFDYFQARRFMKDPAALEIQSIVNETGYRIVRSKAHNARTIKAVDTLIQIHREGGGELLRWTLEMHSHWVPRDHPSVHGALLGGLAYWKMRTRTSSDLPPKDAHLRKRIVTRTPEQLLARAVSMSVGTGGGRSPRYIAEAISEIYNWRLIAKSRVILR